MPSSRLLRLAALALIVGLVIGVSQPSAVRAAFERLLRFIELGGEPVLASVPVISDHEIEELKLASPQEQAERLLERAINGYRGANELIEAQLGTWPGQIAMEGRLDALFRVAIDSSNLRVRAAAIEIYLASFSIQKTSEQVAFHQETIRENPQDAPWHLWVLGFLANRDVNRAEILGFLLPYLDDPEIEIRHWAVEGLAFSGDRAIIPHLLRVFHDDPEPFIRERAACGLAQSGMLTSEARYLAVPDLLNFSEDPVLDDQTRLWVYQALRDITGESLPNEPSAWRDWWWQQS
jgi:hypothetical protein